MSREKKLVKNTIIIAIGQICTKFMSFFLLPLYTALLTPKEYGIVDLFNTYISLLLPIIFFQIEQAVFRYLVDYRNDEKNKKEIISTSILFMAFQSIIYVIVFVIISRIIDNEYKFFLLSNVIAAMLANIVLQISRGLGDNTAYSVGSVISGAGTILFNVILIVIFDLGAYGLLISTLISNLMCFTYIFIKKRLFKYIDIRSFKVECLKNILKYSIPLIPNQLSWWIINASDRTIISTILGIAANGIYSAANKFSTICVTIFNIFNLSWTESASIHYKDNDNSLYFSKIMNDVIKIFSCLCMLVIAFMPFIFDIFIKSSDYSAAFFQIPILMIAAFFNICVAFLGSIYVSLKKTKEIAKTSIYAAIINIAINCLLIKKIGLYAASISTLIAYLSMTIYRFVDVQKYIRISIDKKYIIIILFIPILLLSYYINNKIFNTVMLGITIVFALCFCKSIIKVITNKIKHKLSKSN